MTGTHRYRGGEFIFVDDVLFFSFITLILIYIIYIAFLPGPSYTFSNSSLELIIFPKNPKSSSDGTVLEMKVWFLDFCSYWVRLFS